MEIKATESRFNQTVQKDQATLIAELISRVTSLEDDMEYVLEHLPTTEAENCPLIEIVRCGECKKHGKNSCPMTFTYAVITDDNNYCSYAERRADE